MQGKSREFVVVNEEQKEQMMSTSSSKALNATSCSEDQYIDENSFSSPGKDFNDLKNKVTNNLVSANDDEKCLWVYPGINFKGQCYSENCSASKNQRVSWIRKDYGTFNIFKVINKNKCKDCGEPIDPDTITNFGFSRARIIINGKKVTSGGQKQLVDDQQIVENQGKFITFKDSYQNVCRWQYLEITVQKL